MRRGFLELMDTMPQAVEHLVGGRCQQRYLEVQFERSRDRSCTEHGTFERGRERERLSEGFQFHLLNPQGLSGIVLHNTCWDPWCKVRNDAKFFLLHRP